MKRNSIFGLSCGWVMAGVLVAFVANGVAGPSDPPNLISYQGYLVDHDGKPLGTTPGGDPDPTIYDVQFSIYDSAAGATLLWREQQTITVDSGHFSVYLGEGIPMDVLPPPSFLEVFSGLSASERFIGIAVRFESSGDFVAVLPRLRMASTPYAVVAASSRSLLNQQGERLVTLDAVDGGNVSVHGELQVYAPVSVDSIRGNGAGLQNLNASALASGTIHPDRVPGLDASKITSGVFDASRLPAAALPDLPASKITSGTIHPDRIPGLDASKVPWDAFPHHQVPGLPADRIQWGEFHRDRIPWHYTRNFEIRHGAGPALVCIAHHHYPGWGYFRRLHGRMDVGGHGLYYHHHFPPMQGLSRNRRVEHASYDGDSNWDFHSDARMKKDVEDVEPMLDRALQIQVRRYRWKGEDETGRHKMGVISQEIQPLFPELVSLTPYNTAEPGSEEPIFEDYYMVGYTHFALIALQSLQELNHRRGEEIDALRRLAEQRAGEIVALRQMVEQLTGN